MLDKVREGHVPAVLRDAMGKASVAPWSRCDLCEDYWCWIHHNHVHDCPCPPAEEWEFNPYEPPPDRRVEHGVAVSEKLHRLMEQYPEIRRWTGGECRPESPAIGAYSVRITIGMSGPQAAAIGRVVYPSNIKSARPGWEYTAHGRGNTLDEAAERATAKALEIIHALREIETP